MKIKGDFFCLCDWFALYGQKVRKSLFLWFTINPIASYKPVFHDICKLWGEKTTKTKQIKVQPGAALIFHNPVCIEHLMSHRCSGKHWRQMQMTHTGVWHSCLPANSSVTPLFCERHSVTNGPSHTHHTQARATEQVPVTGTLRLLSVTSTQWQEIEEVASCNLTAGFSGCGLIVIGQSFDAGVLFNPCVAGRESRRLHRPHQLHDWQSHRVQEEAVSPLSHSLSVSLQAAFLWLILKKRTLPFSISIIRPETVPTH